MICTTCDDTGWVCEAHADRPWAGLSERDDACACSTGASCSCYAAPLSGNGTFATIICEAFRPRA